MSLENLNVLKSNLNPKEIIMSHFIVASDSFYVNSVDNGFIHLLNEGNPEPEYYHFSSKESADRITLRLNESLDVGEDTFSSIPVNLNGL